MSLLVGICRYQEVLKVFVGIVGICGFITMCRYCRYV